MFSVASVKQWHWLPISLVVGLALGWVNRFTSDELMSYGNAINDQRRFEEALVRRMPEAGDRRQFEDPVVHRVIVKGRATEAYVVAGRYCANPFQPDPKDGMYHFRPAFFVASSPYQPLTDAGSAAFGALKHPTVIDFLADLARTDHITYRHLWWKSYPLVAWPIGCVLLIGVLWPFAVNRWLWGTWLRPAEEKGIDLSQYTSEQPAKPTAVDVGLGLPAGDDEEELASVPASAATASPGPAVQKLEVAPLAAVRDDHRHAEYGARQEDYYPTEAHRPSHK
jgi:hypothetical protein